MPTESGAFPGHHPGQARTRGKGLADQLEPLSRTVQTFFELGKLLFWQSRTVGTLSKVNGEPH